jgi:hypothetical protein
MTTHLLYDDEHNPTNIAISFGGSEPLQQLAMTYHPRWQVPATLQQPDLELHSFAYTNGSIQSIEQGNVNGH